MIDFHPYPSLCPIEKLAELLRSSGQRFALAESCTSGLVAAKLGSIPGVSEFFCGSMVVYRTPTKTAWLAISQDLLSDPHQGPVSANTTQQLAFSILNKTPEADFAATVTGHLGPASPTGLDGVVFVCIAKRHSHGAGPLANTGLLRKHQLQSPSPKDSFDLQARQARQEEAAQIVLATIAEWLALEKV